MNWYIFLKYFAADTAISLAAHRDFDGDDNISVGLIDSSSEVRILSFKCIDVATVQVQTLLASHWIYPNLFKIFNCRTLLHQLYYSKRSDDKFISVQDIGNSEADVIEIYDLPDNAPFEENPDFDYVSQSPFASKYPFMWEKKSSNYVFEVDEIFAFLEAEKFSNIVTIRIPKEDCYGDFVMIASGISVKHIGQASSILRQLFKLKRSSAEMVPLFHGLAERSEWIAADFGNIILHLFATAECRNRYDLESLWTLGRDFDLKAKGLDPYEKTVNPSASRPFTQADWERILAEVTNEEMSESNHQHRNA